MFLLCWTPGQSSKIDDHSKNGCIMKVLDGNINDKDNYEVMCLFLFF